eukprot:Nitzschia sp. Nitz4//scaffold139_size61406//25051//26331//NITZ4_006455-RA/size61406-processed-gene-0.56-mRNA-1//1//CDS//3329535837//3387//frame0
MATDVPSKKRKTSTRTPLPVDRQWISKLLQKHPNPRSLRPDKALVVAPMVDQSDLPFRLLARRYGSNLCFTPMIHSRLLVTSKAYKKKFIGTWLEQDRPLIAQLCGSDPDTLLEAAQLLEPHVDGIDINCGCPQGIARRGNYGAFLLEQPDVLLPAVKHLLQHLTVPLSVKVRLLPVAVEPAPGIPSAKPEGAPQIDLEKSFALYQQLVDAGVHMLTIHGRTRHHKAQFTDHADWAAIRQAVERFGDRIPILANGSIEVPPDIERCLEATQADGVMSSESILEYPPLFDVQYKYPVRTVGRIQLAKEYLEVAKQYPPHIGGQGNEMKCVRVHVHRLLHADLARPDLRTLLIEAASMEALEEAIQKVEEHHMEVKHVVSEEKLSWYRRHRGDPQPDKVEDVQKEEKKEEEEEEQVCTFFSTQDDGDY